MSKNTLQTPTPNSSFFQRLKGKIAPSYFGFVFELFMENRVHPYYEGVISNTLTHKKYDNIPIIIPPKTSGNTSVIYDVPGYLEVPTPQEDQGLKLKKVTQYKGFLVNLLDYGEVETYLRAQLSKRNIKNLRAKLRKFEENRSISYKFHFGHIDKDHYDYLFDVFYDLLEKRFEEKKMYNKNLIRWKYYHELAYPLILNKKASLFVIYDGDSPIILTLNFLLGDTVFSFMQTYDIAYSQYNLGDISMLKHLEWCKENGIVIFDLSMGETDYKIKWCNHTYDFEHHLFYDPKSALSLLLTFFLAKKLNLKQYLRDKDIIGKWFQYDKFFYKSRKKKLEHYNWKGANTTL